MFPLLWLMLDLLSVVCAKSLDTFSILANSFISFVWKPYYNLCAHSFNNHAVVVVIIIFAHRMRSLVCLNKVVWVGVKFRVHGKK